MTDVGVYTEFIEKPVVLARNFLRPSGRGELIQVTKRYSSLDSILGILTSLTGRVQRNSYTPRETDDEDREMDDEKLVNAFGQGYVACTGGRIRIAYNEVNYLGVEEGKNGRDVITIRGWTGAPIELIPRSIKVHSFPHSPDLDFVVLRYDGLKPTGVDKHHEGDRELYARAPDGTAYHMNRLFGKDEDGKFAENAPEGTEPIFRFTEPGQIVFVRDNSILYDDEQRRWELEELLIEGIESQSFRNLLHLARVDYSHQHQD